jgi:hypothetical protein
VNVGDIQHAINRVLESPMTRVEFDAWIEDQEDGVVGTEERWKKIPTTFRYGSYGAQSIDFWQTVSFFVSIFCVSSYSLLTIGQV